MKFNKIFTLAAVSALSLGFSACIDDESTYGTPSELPSLSVATGTDPDKIPVVNNYHGSETVIDPKIEYTGTNPLSYEWCIPSTSRAADGFEVISTEPVFRYTFPLGGTYQVILNVTDGEIGFSQEYEVNVNRTFESGYCVISNNGAGEGRLVFLKDMTPEELEEGIEPIVFDDCIAFVLPEAPHEPMVGVQLIHPSWPMDAKARLMVSTSKRCYFLDPNTFALVSNIEYPSDFNAEVLLPFSAECVALDSKAHRAVTIMSEDAIAVEETSWKNISYDGVAINTYEAYGNLNSEIAYITKNPASLSTRAYSYDTGAYVYSATTELVNDEWIATGVGQQKIEYVDYGEWGIIPQDVYTMYSLSRDKSNGDIIWSCFSGFSAYANGAPSLLGRKVVGNASSAIPAVDSNFAASDIYQRTYYYNGNHVYVMLEGTDGINDLPSPSQWALEYPSDEEITFIDVDKTSVKNSETLIVATVNTSTGRGNIYFYDPRNVRTDNPGAKPSKSYLDCADRISSVFYKKRV